MVGKYQKRRPPWYLIDGAISILEADAVEVVVAEDSVEVVLGTAAEIDPDSAGRSTGCSVTVRCAATQKEQATDCDPLKAVRSCLSRGLSHDLS